MEKLSIPQDLEYLAIFTLVLILPKVLLRLRVPSGITALSLGMLIGHFDPLLESDNLFRFLAQIGITSLFVFAGLEVNFEEIKRDRVYLSKYGIKSIVSLFLIAFGLQYFLNLSYQNALILSLGIATPSAGFIINSLHSLNVGKDHEYWIKSKAISKELISIVFLFIALQVNDLEGMAYSSLFFVALFFIMPTIFKLFFKFISPYAPNTEVPFLISLSLVCGVLSKEVGAYYLVGAFIVGLIGSRFKSEIFRENEDVIFKSLNSFFNVFLPFYFFFAGLKMTFQSFSFDALELGAIFFIIFIPLRFLLNSLSFRFLSQEFLKSSYKVSLSLLPTLIFGLVIAGILQERGEVSEIIIYALVFYTLISSLIPTILFSLNKNKEGDLGKS